MNENIKEILEYFKSSNINRWGYEQDKIITYKDANQLSDYITNLQEELKSANESITWWQNRFNALQEENERLNNIIKIMEKYFELIIDLGYDYDGFNQVESLKGLIDELVKYASLGRAYNTTEPIYEDGKGKIYNIINKELKGDDNEKK